MDMIFEFACEAKTYLRIEENLLDNNIYYSQYSFREEQRKDANIRFQLNHSTNEKNIWTDAFN